MRTDGIILSGVERLNSIYLGYGVVVFICGMNKCLKNQ